MFCTSLLIVEGVDLFLNELECRKEYRIYNARSSHGYTKSSIHPPIEELDFRRFLDLLALAMSEAIPLINTFRRVDWIDQGPRCYSTDTSSKHYTEWICWRLLATVCSQQLFAALIRHEIDPGAQSIPNYALCQ